MRIRGIIFPVVILALSLASSCDFPADPPMRTGDGPITPPVSDTVRVLLPLTGDEHWTYLVDPRSKPLSAPRTVTPRKLERNGETFFYLPYLYSAGGMGPTSFAFPSLLRNDTLGLGFYLPVSADDTTRLIREPKFMFRLPFPARRGSSTVSGEFRVFCTHTDTMMTILSTGIQIPTHRYEVWKGAFPQSFIYVIPGVALLRISIEDLTYHTVGWQL